VFSSKIILNTPVSTTVYSVNEVDLRTSSYLLDLDYLKVNELVQCSKW